MAISNPVTLIAKQVTLYSEGDEFALHGWLEHLKPFATFRYVLDTIEIEVASNKIEDDQLRDLIGLFRRYHIDKRQLSAFDTSDNLQWIKDWVVKNT